MYSHLFLQGSALGITDAATEATANRAERIASDVSRSNESLQFDVGKLFMITEALWTLLKEEHGYSEERLSEVIKDIDLRDGKLDGKVGPSGESPLCTNCGRHTSRRHSRCIYCGTVAKQDPFMR